MISILPDEPAAGKRHALDMLTEEGFVVRKGRRVMLRRYDAACRYNMRWALAQASGVTHTGCALAEFHLEIQGSRFGLLSPAPACLFQSELASDGNLTSMSASALVPPGFPSAPKLII